MHIWTYLAHHCEADKPNLRDSHVWLLVAVGAPIRERLSSSLTTLCSFACYTAYVYTNLVCGAGAADTREITEARGAGVAHGSVPVALCRPSGCGVMFTRFVHR